MAEFAWQVFGILLLIQCCYSENTCLETRFDDVSCRSEERTICNFTTTLYGSNWNFFPYRNCFCDDLCHVYGDCCSEIRNDVYSSALSKDAFSCTKPVNMYTFEQYIYIVDKCPSNWKDNVIRSLCEEESTDVFLQWPVTGNSTGILYKNVYCSRCYEETDVLFWVSEFTCPMARVDKTQSDVTKIISGLIDKGLCFTNFSHPTDPLGYRFCKPAINTCRADYELSCVKNKCNGVGSTTNYVYVNPPSSSPAIYKNKWCAFCNDIPLSSLKCFDKVTKYPINLITGKVPEPQLYPLSIVIDLNSGSGKIQDFKVGQKSGGPETEVKTEIRRCQANHVYDPFAATCRPVYCTSQLNDGVCSSTEDKLDKNCPYKMKINISEISVHNNGSIFDKSSETWYDSDDYELYEEFALVCTNFTQNYTDESTIRSSKIILKFSTAQTIVSVVGQTLSIIALAIHFVIYIILPALRNLPGKNLLCLVSALFVAQLLFLVGVGRTRVYGVCVIIAMLLHYSFLAAFFWMNIMAFDIWKTFSHSGSQSVSSSQSKRFRLYSIYAWGTPFVIVLLSTVLNFTLQAGPLLLVPGYGLGLCWITNRPALLVLFAVPLAILLVLDIVFFVMTVVSIYRVSQATKMVQTNKSEKKRLFLYIKLSIIMGLTWVFGFVATLGDVTVLWYLFIIFNTLQGLFICMAFVCTKKVFRLLRERFVKKKLRLIEDTDTTRSTGLSTRSTSGVQSTLRNQSKDL